MKIIPLIYKSAIKIGRFVFVVARVGVIAPCAILNSFALSTMPNAIGVTSISEVGAIGERDEENHSDEGTEKDAKPESHINLFDLTV